MEKKTESNVELNVLCLEDVLKDTELINEILANAGYLVSMDIASKEKEYLFFLKSQSYDIILADYTLPGFDAPSALKFALQFQPEVPFICVSGTIGEEKAVELLKQGASDYVLKERLGRLPFAVKRALAMAEYKKEHKQTQDTLRASYEFNQSLLQTIPFGMGIVDEDGNILFMSEGSKQHFGNRTLDKKCWELYHDDKKQCKECPLRTDIKTGETRVNETHRVFGGKIFEVSYTGMIFNGKKALLEIFKDITAQKQAETLLLASEKKYHSIFDNIQDVFYQTDLSGTVLDVSPSIKYYSEFNRDEIVGKPVTNLYYDPKDRDSLIGLLMEKGEFRDYELRIKTRTGELKYVSNNARLVFDDDGKPNHIDGAIRDITQRKLAEIELEQSKDFLNNIINAVASPVFVKDVNHKYVLANNAYSLLVNFPIEKIIGSIDSKFFPEEQIKVFIAKDNEVFKTGKENINEEYLTDGTGNIRTIVTRKTLYTDTAGNKFLVGVINDITGRKLAEDELRESQLMLKSSIESPKDMIVLSIDKQYKYLYFNTFHKNVMLNAYGKDIELGMNLLDCISNEDDIIKSKTNYERAFNGESHTTIEEYGELNRYYYETRYNPILNDKNEVIGATAFAVNITERKLAEKHIERLNRVYTVLSNINKTIVRVHDKLFLFDEACRIAVDNGGFKMSWIGMVNSVTNEIDVVASFGKTGEFLSNINIDLNNKELSSGPAGLAIKSGKCNFSNNIETDDRTIYWRKTALEYGYRSVIALPVIVWGKTIGVYMIYSGEIDFFNEDEIKLLEEMATDISFALEFMESEKERKKAEKKIHEKDIEFRKLSSNLPDLIFQFTRRPDGTYYVPIASEGIKNIFGCSPEEVINDFTPIGRVIHPDDVERVIADIEYSAKHLTFFTCEFRVLIPGKPIQWIYSKSTPEKLPDGSVTWYGFNADISERKLVEDTLVKLKTAIDKSEISVVITDRNGNIEYANPFFNKLTGYSPDEYIGKNSKILKSAYHPKEFYEEMWNTIKSGKTWEGEVYNCKKNGEMYWENVIISPVTNSNNEIAHFVAIKTDITHAKNINSELIIAKEQAEESDRLKSAFLANMSHEIRTPMNGILGFTELLKEPNLSDDQQKYYISIVEKSGERLLNIINDIIDISKIESGLMKVKNSEINVNEYLDQVFTFFNPEAEAKNIKLIFKPGLPKEEAFLKTDSEKFYAILINLVKNGLKYTDTGFVEFGYNRVVETHDRSSLDNSRSLPNHSYLQFYVKDSGIGIPKDRQEAIFERFVQADIVDKMARQGAGLGLSISKAYVEMLKGKIWLESEEENLSAGKSGGSTFYFTLPISANPESENNNRVKILNPVKVVQTNPEVSGLKILIVEDDESSSEFISIGVREFGKEAIKVQTGKEAVEVCRNNPDIDVILMDIQMPELSGHEATRQIRQFNTEVIIIALTAFALTGDREKAIEAGCNDYISKPIKMADLVGMIQKYFKV